MTKTAAVVSLDDFLDHYQYLDCRDDGHQWRKQHDDWVVTGAGTNKIYTKTSQCAECGTVRVKRRNWQRAKLQAHYEWPEGYRSERGMPIRQEDVIQWVLSRQFDSARTGRPHKKRARTTAARRRAPVAR